MRTLLLGMSGADWTLEFCSKLCQHAASAICLDEKGCIFLLSTAEPELRRAANVVLDSLGKTGGRLSRESEDMQVDAHAVMGQIYSADQPPKCHLSLEHFEAALALRPDHERLLFHRAAIHASMMQMGLALKDLRAASKVRPFPCVLRLRPTVAALAI